LVYKIDSLLHPLYHSLNKRHFFITQPVFGIQLAVDIGYRLTPINIGKSFEFPPALAGGQQISIPFIGFSQILFYNFLAKALILYASFL